MRFLLSIYEKLIVQSTLGNPGFNLADFASADTHRSRWHRDISGRMGNRPNEFSIRCLHFYGGVGVQINASRRSGSAVATGAIGS
mgnify:CR=1 FL=1